MMGNLLCKWLVYFEKLKLAFSYIFAIKLRILHVETVLGKYLFRRMMHSYFHFFSPNVGGRTFIDVDFSE